MQKDWQQNYNANVGPDLSRQVSDADVQHIETTLAAEFKKVFTTALQNGGYQLTNSPAPDVLLLRPAIINVQVTAPDIMTAEMDVNVVASAGPGTFYLELWDPSTHTLLARAMDAEADQQPFAQQANSVTNLQAGPISFCGNGPMTSSAILTPCGVSQRANEVGSRTSGGGSISKGMIQANTQCCNSAPLSD
jgi:hypothetical protein